MQIMSAAQNGCTIALTHFLNGVNGQQIQDQSLLEHFEYLGQTPNIQKVLQKSV